MLLDVILQGGYAVVVIKSFGNTGTEDIFNGRNTKEARKVLPKALHQLAQRKLDMINAAAQIQDLRVPPGNRLESLKGDLDGYRSIRVNQQYRIIFQWKTPHAYGVTICDYH